MTTTPAPRVAIVSLGRDAAKGELRRVASWELLFARAGATVAAVELHPGRRVDPRGLRAVLQGDAAPERLAWSGPRLREQLLAFDPALVLVVSARAFDPRALAGSWTTVLDFVDGLSRSYRDRSQLVDGPARRLGYGTLAAAHERLERRLANGRLRAVAAGWADARRLGVEWVPIVADPELRPRTDIEPDRDVLFFGTLRYPPNIDALEQLARAWPAIQRARPGTTALVAGSAPTTRVEELCHAHGWELVADYAALPEVAARARVAVAPLTHTAGIQIKVLDAAVLGLPQVVTSPALEGLEPSVPLVPHDGPDEFGAEIVRLLDDPAAAAVAAKIMHEHVDDRYGATRWTAWVRALLGS
jgi:hypothetical protein